MSGNKINLKDKVSDGEIDLSLCELQEVPVKEIAAIRNVFSLDLSTNHLVKIPNNFVTLTHLTKLDLSKNRIRILPEDFGNLTKLKYLDLYKNELEFLPISFHKLKSLRWLDLKDNPLAPSVLSLAGPCLDAKECQRCAIEMVKFYSEFQENLNTELKKREEQRQLAKHAKEQAEQKQKLQEKKNKKKEKKLKGTEIVGEPAVHTVQNTCIVTNKKPTKITPPKPSSFLQSFFCTFLTLSLLFLSLFIVTSVKLQRIQEFNTYVANVWSNCIHSLPPNMQEYLIIFGEQFHEYHEKTGDRVGNLTNFMNDAISKDDTIIPQLKHIGRVILENFVYYKNQLYEKINYFCMKYVL